MLFAFVFHPNWFCRVEVLHCGKQVVFKLLDGGLQSTGTKADPRWLAMPSRSSTCFPRASSACMTSVLPTPVMPPTTRKEKRLEERLSSAVVPPCLVATLHHVYCKPCLFEQPCHAAAALPATPAIDAYAALRSQRFGLFYETRHFWARDREAKCECLFRVLPACKPCPLARGSSVAKKRKGYGTGHVSLRVLCGRAHIQHGDFRCNILSSRSVQSAYRG